MADDNLQETPPESTIDNLIEPSSKVENSPKEDEGQKKAFQESQEVNSEGKEVRKIPRAERRLKEILAKQKNPLPNLSVAKQEEQNEKVIEITEEQLRQDIQAEVQRGIEMDRADREYKSTAQSHLQDIEDVQKQGISKPVEDLAIKQYQSLNFQYDPVTGRDLFVPIVKFSDIVKDIESKIDLAAQEYATGSRKYREEIRGQSAVPSTSSMSRGTAAAPDTTDFKAFERTYSKK